MKPEYCERCHGYYVPEGTRYSGVYGQFYEDSRCKNREVCALVYNMITIVAEEQKRKVNRMDRLNKVIADVAYICDVLINYRNIVKSGDCNTCAGKCGDYKPKPGQMVRYNCPHYLAREEKQE